MRKSIILDTEVCSCYNQTMIIKKATLLIILLLVSFSVFASTFSLGIDLGYSLGSLIESESTYRENTAYLPGHGYGISIPFQYQSDSGFGVRTGLRFISKSFKYSHPTSIEAAFSFDYIELPVLFSWWSESLSDMIPIHLSFGIGGFVGYKLSTRSSGLFKTSSYDENGKEYVTEISGDFSSDYDNSFEAGLMADAAVYFGIGSGWSAYGQFSAQFPLTALRDKYQENQNMMYLSSYLFSAGVIYEFGGNK